MPSFPSYFSIIDVVDCQGFCLYMSTSLKKVSASTGKYARFCCERKARDGASYRRLLTRTNSILFSRNCSQFNENETLDYQESNYLFLRTEKPVWYTPPGSLSLFRGLCRSIFPLPTFILHSSFRCGHVGR